jgi:hypothetical protein
VNLRSLFNFAPRLPHSKTAPIGLLAGRGQLPLWVAQAIQKTGYPVFVLSVEDDPGEALKRCAKGVLRVGMDQGEAALAFLKNNGVKHLVMVGKIPKKKIYGDSFKPDGVTRATLQKTGKARGDDRILKAVSALLRVKGIHVLEPSLFLSDSVASMGLMTRRDISAQEKEDIDFGLKMAKSIGALDIGQTVVVKEGCVLSVEAIEGTDEAIRRVRDLNVEGGVVVKASKPQQDLRFDMPALGMDTLIHAKASHCRVIAVEAGKTLLLQKSELIKQADELGISLVGV